MVRIVRVVIQVHPSSSKDDLDITTFKLELQPSCSGCGRESCRAARLRARLCCEGSRVRLALARRSCQEYGGGTGRYTAAHMIT